MIWNLVGQRVTGRYHDQYIVTGIVRESRVRYGGTWEHVVELDHEISVFGRSAKVLSLDHSDLLGGRPVDLSVL